MRIENGQVSLPAAQGGSAYHFDRRELCVAVAKAAGVPAIKSAWFTTIPSLKGRHHLGLRAIYWSRARFDLTVGGRIGNAQPCRPIAIVCSRRKAQRLFRSDSVADLQEK